MGRSLAFHAKEGSSSLPGAATQRYHNYKGIIMDDHVCYCTKDVGLDGTGDGARQVCLHKILERIAEALEYSNRADAPNKLKEIGDTLRVIERTIYYSGGSQ